MRRAGPDDVGLLVGLMAEFYGESDYTLDEAHARRAFDDLLADPALGCVFIVQRGGDDVGYAVLTLGYSMEFGGRDAFLDDLFVRPQHRGHGLGTAALAEVRRECERRGVRALHLEVGRDAAGPQALYRRAGFRTTDRMLMTLRLAPPSHVE